MGRLTTHVLDTAHGRPAADLAIRLLRAGESGAVIAETRTNADGRCEAPLLEGEAFRPGRYRLEFAAGDYFRASGMALPEPAFLDVVALEFGLAEDTHYHVPLLLSPYGYSTYRGS